MLAVPRRWIMHALGGIVALSVLARFVLVVHADNAFAMSLLPTRADGLAIGLMAAVVLSRRKAGWDRFRVRAIAPALLIGGVLSDFIGLLPTLGHTMVSGGMATLLLTLIADAPEADRFKGKVLAFVGNTSFAIYLTHLPILWAAHAVFRHAEPSLNDASGWAVSVGCLPLTLAVAWLVTRTVERPITGFGRRFKWKDDPRPDVRDDLRLGHAAMEPAV